MPKELTFKRVKARKLMLPIDKFKICVSIQLIKYQLRQKKNMPKELMITIETFKIKN